MGLNMDAIGGDKITAMLAADGGFPNDNIFNPLLSLAREVKHTIYYDPEAGLNTTYENFITDMIYVRHDLKMQLSAHLNADGALLEERSLVCFLAPASYDLAVAAFAVLALGGTIVPLFFNLKREKAQLIPVKCFLATTEYLQQATYIQSYAASNSLPSVQVAPIQVHHTCPEALWDLPIRIEETLTISEIRPGVIMNSSGTSATKKGVIRSRGFFYNQPRAPADEAVLVNRPATWIEGIQPLTLSVLMSRRVEIGNPAAGMDILWERLRARRVTTINSGPMMWMQLAQYYSFHVLHLTQKNEYIQGARHVRDASTGSCVALHSLLKFWRDEIGIRLAVCYGSIEIGVPITAVYPEEEEYDEQRCIGKQLFTDMPVKLSNGGHGEILVGGVTTFFKGLDTSMMRFLLLLALTTKDSSRPEILPTD